MSILNSYLQKEQQLKKLQEELKMLEYDDRLKHELKFKEKLEALMRESGKSASDVITLLNPKSTVVQSSASSPTSGRAKRKLKIYKNPKTGEIVETRGANQKTLKAWKEEHGTEVVESWLVRTAD